MDQPEAVFRFIVELCSVGVLIPSPAGVIVGEVSLDSSSATPSEQFFFKKIIVTFFFQNLG